jgi:hypothetical protein
MRVARIKFGSKIYFPPSLSISTILHVYVKKSKLIYGIMEKSRILKYWKG